jgi:hypothetical protein
MPTDNPTYAYYHLQKMEKNFLDESKLVLCDLTPAELSSAFVLSMTESQRQQLKSELKYLTLLDTTQWLADNYKYGCSQCASFLNRSKVNQTPRRPIQLLGEEQMPSFKIREMNIAY